MKDQKGITLVALVITIIVLLILAGVSISLVTGDNGILTQSVKSKDETLIASEEEAIAVAWNTQMSKHLAVSDDINSTSLEEQLISGGDNVTVGYVDDDNTKDYLVTFTDSNNTYQVDRRTGKTTGPID